MAPDDVAAVCAGVVGARAERVERLAGSVGNHDFLLGTARGDFVLKASATQDLAPEVWACERVRQVGVRAPEVVWFEPQPQSLPMPLLVMRRLPGVPVDATSPALAAAGEQLALVHSVQLPGYGGLLVEDSLASGSHDQWDSFVGELSSGLANLVDAGVLDGSAATAAIHALEGAAEELSHDAPAVLLHGDLKLAHIFGQADGGVALIDWGDAAAGDPRFDLGRMSMAGSAAFAAFLSGYGLAVTPELERSLAAYRLLWNLDALTYEFRAGGDWFDAYRTGIATAVAELRR